MSDIFSFADTWNNAGTTFTAIKMNVTNTASAAGSKLIDVQVGGVSQFNVDKLGNASLGDGTFGGGQFNITSSAAGANVGLSLQGYSGTIAVTSGGAYQFSSSATQIFAGVDAAFERQSPGVIKATNAAGGAGLIRLPALTVATLPAAATAGVGARSTVTDALAPTFMATVTAGGAVITPVYSDGTNWKVG